MLYLVSGTVWVTMYTREIPEVMGMKETRLVEAESPSQAERKFVQNFECESIAHAIEYEVRNCSVFETIT